MAFSKVILNTNGTDVTLIDLTQDTVESSVLGTGYTAHDNAGLAVNGSATIGNEIGFLNSTTSVNNDLSGTPSPWPYGWAWDDVKFALLSYYINGVRQYFFPGFVDAYSDSLVIWFEVNGNYEVVTLTSSNIAFSGDVTDYGTARLTMCKYEDYTV